MNDIHKLTKEQLEVDMNYDDMMGLMYQLAHAEPGTQITISPAWNVAASRFINWSERLVDKCGDYEKEIRFLQEKNNELKYRLSVMTE